MLIELHYCLSDKLHFVKKNHIYVQQRYDKIMRTFILQKNCAFVHCDFSFYQKFLEKL